MFSLIFSILYSVFNEHFLNLIFIKFCKHLILLKCLQNSMILSPTGPACWLDWVDSNHRPHAYQACALTPWATIHYQGVRPLWWRWWDSNPWPPACRAGALPAELHPHKRLLLLCVFNRRSGFLHSPTVSALSYLPVQSPVKYFHHCRA